VKKCKANGRNTEKKTLIKSSKIVKRVPLSFGTKNDLLIHNGNVVQKSVPNNNNNNNNAMEKTRNLNKKSLALRRAHRSISAPPINLRYGQQGVGAPL